MRAREKYATNSDKKKVAYSKLVLKLNILYINYQMKNPHLRSITGFNKMKVNLKARLHYTIENDSSPITKRFHASAHQPAKSTC